MKLERTIQANINENTMYERITAYFQKAGYQLVRSRPSLGFRRGSLLGSIASFSPKGWKVYAIARLSSQDKKMVSKVTLIIDTIGQWVTDRERMFWQNELDALEEAVITGDNGTNISTEDAKSAVIQNVLSVILILGLGGIMAWGGRSLIGTRAATILAGAIGVGLGLLIAHIWLKFKINA